MNRSDLGWRTIAITISIIVHGIVAYVLIDNAISADVKISDEPLVTQIRLDFIPPTPEPEKDPEPEPEPEKKSEPEPEPEPTPVPRPIPKPKPKPKPVKKIKKHRQEQMQQKEKIAGSLKKRDAYLSDLIRRIERKKFYPRVARRRNLQGNIRVKLSVRCNGSITNLRVNGGHKLLESAAAKAVRNAAPFPRPPSGIGCPLAINYSMRFKMQR
jgi:periplasmic protein TonB